VVAFCFSDGWPDSALGGASVAFFRSLATVQPAGDDCAFLGFLEWPVVSWQGGDAILVSGMLRA